MLRIRKLLLAGALGMMVVCASVTAYAGNLVSTTLDPDQKAHMYGSAVVDSGGLLFKNPYTCAGHKYGDLADAISQPYFGATGNSVDEKLELKDNLLTMIQGKTKGDYITVRIWYGASSFENASNGKRASATAYID